MALKNHSGGLLSRVAKFVRNPTKDWFEVGAVQRELDTGPQSSSGYSKQSLKEMIEYKRSNDVVRRREFDHLRKLLRNVPVPETELTGRASVYPDSTSSELGERAKTLQKIDEIEAHMSRQWWKGKADTAALRGNYAKPVPHTLAQAPDGESSILTLSSGGGAFSPTMAFESDSEFDLSQAAQDDAAALGQSQLMGASSFEDSPQKAAFNRAGLINPAAIDKGENLTDPDLEEAAIRFANGDDAGAEATLLTALRAEQVDPELACLWAMALFDLYRATGQQDSFDRVAIEYAQRFGQSAPAWFSTPELLALSGTGPSLVLEPPPRPPSQLPWRCPALLDLPALQAMQAGLPATTQPWHLNWSQLESITPEAGSALAQLFAQWCAQDVKLNFHGVDVLEKTLRLLTPPDDRQRDGFWWQLRLDALRILRLQDEFELAALDYCVIYEISPPPWLDARCEYVGETVAGQVIDTRAVVTAAVASPEPPSVSSIELSGELLGEVTDKLDALPAGLSGGHRFVISSSRLIRVDFAAAGSILNWVARRESEGCYVQFRNVPCLVAAFFKVIGVHEHARVLVRNR